MKPVLLLIPGMLNDARVWHEVAQALAAEADVRIADVARQDSIAGMRGDAWALVSDLPASTPLVLAGFSMGGYVALDMLAHAPRPLHGLLLVSTSAMPETEQSRTGREKSLAAMAKDFPRFVDTVLSWNTQSTDPVLLERMRQMMLEQGAETARRQTLAVMGRADHRALLQTLRIPARILCGKLDRVTPPALSETLAQLIPQSRLEMVDGAGHMLPCEQPEAVTQALRDLILNRNLNPN